MRQLLNMIKLAAVAGALMALAGFASAQIL